MTNNIPKKLYMYYMDLPLRPKLFISYFLIISLSLGLFAYASYMSVSKGFENQVFYSAQQSFNQACTFIDYKVNSLVSASDILYYSEDIQSLLTKKLDTYSSDIIQQNIDMLKNSSFLKSFENNNDIYRATLYVPGGLMFSDQNINFYNVNQFKETPDYKKLMESSGKVLWLPTHTISELNGSKTKVISLLRKIRNQSQLTEMVGVVSVSTLDDNLVNILSKSCVSQNSVAFILNSSGEIVCSSNEKLLLSYNNLDNLSLSDIDSSDHFSQSITLNGLKFIYLSKTINATDWKVISVIPYSEVFSQSFQIRNNMVILMLIVSIFAYILAYFISAFSTKQFTLIIKRMRKVQKGEFSSIPISNSRSEIGALIENFNFMILKVKDLLNEQYENGKTVKNAELKALQAQINPHFLYNTLDLINWKAMENNVPEIEDITQSLAKFYKLSLNKGKDIISIRSEIEHVRTYVHIQNMRFDEKINFMVNVPEDLYEYSILKIILQPLVENSILHGILENPDKSGGLISISGKLQEGVITLSVEDDGVGMDAQTLIELLEDTITPSENHGYGVKNINQRIKLIYGEAYGLSYSSNKGYGTKVEICIPLTPFL